MGDIFSTSPVRSAFFISSLSTVRFMPAPAMEHCVRRGSCNINLVSSPMASGVVAASHFFRNSRSLLQNAGVGHVLLSCGCCMHLCTGSSPIKNFRRPPAGSTVFASLASAIALILLAQLELGGSFRGLRARDAASSACTVISLISTSRSAATAAKTDCCGRWRLLVRGLGISQEAPPLLASGAKDWISGTGNDDRAAREALFLRLWEGICDKGPPSGAGWATASAPCGQLA